MSASLFDKTLLIKLLSSSERIFLDSLNSKSTVLRCSETCESALGLKIKITRYKLKDYYQQKLL